MKYKNFTLAVIVLCIVGIAGTLVDSWIKSYAAMQVQIAKESQTIRTERCDTMFPPCPPCPIICPGERR